jgi:outer membrane receptor for ferrienterochelin and colicin
MTRSKARRILRLTAMSLAITSASQVLAQQASDTLNDDSTVVYAADYFAEYSPVSVNDMIDRIPGIGLALNRRNGGGGRGLGSGEGEILINGQRITGKSNEGRSQLSRISADQVAYIEIIRGTSESLDVRGGGQVVNVVLLDTPSRSSISAEINADLLHDGTVDPGAKLSYSGQSGNFNYLFHVEAEPRYQNRFSTEVSRDASGILLETRDENDIRDQTEFQTSLNVGYQFEKSLLQLNGLYGFSSPPSDVDRTITDFTGATPAARFEHETNENDRSNWEIGGDYEYEFNNRSKYRLLFIVNDREWDNTRERFNVAGASETKNLYLFNSGRDRERIVRTSYTFDPAPGHGVELGVERAQTIRDGNLRLGLALSGTPDSNYGGLVPYPVANSNSKVQEIRLENFAVHNWQLNDRMSLESSLVYETSTISQTGDVRNSRDFDFLRPKFDYRFDINQSLQLRGTIEKTVSQLSFSDFSASADNSDDDQDTQAGNPDIAQEQAWNYELNLEYRLPNDIGVLNSMVYYREIEDVIDRIDISTGPNNLASARGNIGDGTRWGMNLDASSRLGFIGLPNALLSLGFGASDSKVTDPFLGVERRLNNNGRGFGRMNFRHDVVAWNFSYGLNMGVPINGGSGRTQIDIIDIETERSEPNLNLFMEKKAFGGVTFRLDVQNATDSENCRERIRYVGATVAGIIEEIEDYCSGSGPKIAFKARHTF